MNQKVGRNDPCPCGSGKKYKQCCLLKKEEKTPPRKLKAVWVNQPVSQEEPVNLIERTFGSAIATASNKPPQPVAPISETDSETAENKNNESNLP